MTAVPTSSPSASTRRSAKAGSTKAPASTATSSWSAPTRCTSRNGAPSSRSEVGPDGARRCASRPTFVNSGAQPRRCGCCARSLIGSGWADRIALPSACRSHLAPGEQRTFEQTAQVLDAAAVVDRDAATSTLLASELLASDERLIDNFETRFGIRTIRFDAERGFFLNGKAGQAARHCQSSGSCRRRHRHSRRAPSLARRAAEGNGLERLAERAQPAGDRRCSTRATRWAC